MARGENILGGKSVGQLIGEGLQEFAAALKKNKQSIPDEFTCHKIVMNLSPTPYDAELVKKTRKLLGASQAIFARFLGVSISTVRAWEQGANTPQDVACRLMDEIHHNPDYWKARLRDLVVKKSPKKVNP